eukprot:1885510-Rhodomonas_salina.1
MQLERGRRGRADAAPDPLMRWVSIRQCRPHARIVWRRKKKGDQEVARRKRMLKVEMASHSTPMICGGGAPS